MSVKIRELDESTYMKYRGQTQPQDCFLELDCERRTMTVRYNTEIGNAVPHRVYHCHVLRYWVPYMGPDQANWLMQSVSVLAETVCDGYDGSELDAVYTEEAYAASEEIERLCGLEESVWKVWDASQWFCPLGDKATQCRELGISADTTDDEMGAIIEHELNVALGHEECDEIEGVETYLEDLRAWCVAKTDSGAAYDRGWTYGSEFAKHEMQSGVTDVLFEPDSAGLLINAMGVNAAREVLGGSLSDTHIDAYNLGFKDGVAGVLAS